MVASGGEEEDGRKMMYLGDCRTETGNERNGKNETVETPIWHPIL